MKFRLVLAFVFLFLMTAHGLQASDAPPNVLFISVDDLNNWTGRLKGHPQAETPNIDRLTEMGVLFSNCHCAAPACNPSRVALMTGRRPSSTGIYFNATPWKPALESMTTLPQHFQQHGYYALGSGKIYHGGHPPSWNEYAPSKSRHTFPKSFPFPENVNGLDKNHFDWGPIPQQASQMPDSKTVDYVVEQLEKDWDQPYFLACGIFRPHLPWYVPQEYFDRFPLEKIQLPETMKNDLADVPKPGVRMARPEGDHAAVTKANEWKKAVQGYLASIAFTDDLIGRVLDAYEKSPQRNNTIIVFWTDHGWHLGEKEHWRKFALWEDATQVVMSIAVPEMETAGEICDAPCNLIDLYPTLIDLCGLEERDDLEGDSLVAQLNDPESGSERISLTTHGPNNHAIRSQHFRFIQYANGDEELYDHRNDPHEWKNLAGNPEYRDVLKQHRADLPEVNVPDLRAQEDKGTRKKAKRKTN